MLCVRMYLDIIAICLLDHRKNVNCVQNVTFFLALEGNGMFRNVYSKFHRNPGILDFAMRQR